MDDQQGKGGIIYLYVIVIVGGRYCIVCQIFQVYLDVILFGDDVCVVVFYCFVQFDMSCFVLVIIVKVVVDCYLFEYWLGLQSVVRIYLVVVVILVVLFFQCQIEVLVAQIGVEGVVCKLEEQFIIDYMFKGVYVCVVNDELFVVFVCVGIVCWVQEQGYIVAIIFIEQFFQMV